MTGQLAGQVAIITGGSRGIGRAIGLLFAREGADVAFCHLDDGSGAGDVTRALEAMGRRAFHRSLDVADTDALRRFVADVEAALGPADVLVNNAGMNIRGEFATLDDAAFDRVMAVHVKAAWVASQAVWAGMSARGRGRRAGPGWAAARFP